jgi:transposase
MTHRITGGVDTHLDVHVAAALNELGALVGTRSFAATARGYGQLLAWLASFGTVELVGVEGTGSYGAGLTRYLHAKDVAVVEVDRPNRQARRRQGKSDAVDAVAAARAAQGGMALGQAKTRTGNVESMRVLRLVKQSARKSKTMALNQMRSIVATGPEQIREAMRYLPAAKLVHVAAGLRPSGQGDVLAATKVALRSLARRIQVLDGDIEDINALIEPLVEATAPELLAQPGVGPDVASALLIAVGDNPERLRSERSFAALCGVAPLDASSGKQQRHRYSRAGDRQANSALWRVVMTRTVYDPRTSEYIQRRMKEGLSKREAMRCLKRYIARELYPYLPRPSAA